MIDFHSHVDLYPDPVSVVKEAVRRRCYVLAVTTTPLAWAGTRQVIDNAPRIQLGLGLHPELVAQRAHEVRVFVDLVPQAKFIGEIGLDGSPRHRSSLPLQTDVFQTILATVAKEGGRVMSIHSRGAATAVLDELERCMGPSVPVLHWFSGSLRELQRAIELGCWFSVGPVMLRTEKGRQLVERMPSARVLTETDGPFTRNGNKPFFPWDSEYAERELSTLWRVEPSEASRRLRVNLSTLVSPRI